MKTNKIFDVVGKRKIFYTFSIAVIVLSIVLSFVLGMDVAIEFRGGTIITYSYTGDISDSEIASAAAEVTGHTCDVSLGESLADNAQTVSLSFPTSSGLTAEVQSELTDALTSEFSGNQLELYNSQDVNPTTGAGFLGKCIVAVAFSKSTPAHRLSGATKLLTRTKPLSAFSRLTAKAIGESKPIPLQR